MTNKIRPLTDDEREQLKADAQSCQDSEFAGPGDDESEIHE